MVRSKRSKHLEVSRSGLAPHSAEVLIACPIAAPEKFVLVLLTLPHEGTRKESVYHFCGLLLKVIY